MGMPVVYKRKPGIDNRTDRERADDLLTQISKLVEWADETPRNEEDVPFPNIPVRANGSPARRLTSEEEFALATRFHQFGDLKARNLLMLSQIGMVYVIANQYRRKLGEQFEDGLQEGYAALFRAAEMFDPGRCIRFSTYSAYWLRAAIGRFADKEREAGKADVEGCPKHKVALVRLDAPMFDDDSDTEADRVADKVARDPEKIALIRETRELVQRCAANVAGEMKDPRVKSIVLDRLLSDSPQTLAQIATKYDISRERVRQIEERFLRLFKHKAEKRFENRVA